MSHMSHIPQLTTEQTLLIVLLLLFIFIVVPIVFICCCCNDKIREKHSIHNPLNNSKIITYYP